MNQITSLLYSLVAAWASVFKGKFEDVKPRVLQIVSDTEKSIADLAAKVASGEIKPEDALKHLEQEALLLKTEGIELAIVGVSFTEDQLNDWNEKLRVAFEAIFPKQQ